jgi:hypothetical protein
MSATKASDRASHRRRRRAREREQVPFGECSAICARSDRLAAFLPNATVRSVPAIAALLLVVLATAVGVAPAAVAKGPTASSRPTIVGSATQGSRVTATPGSWHGSGTVRYVYRWYRCDTMGGHCSPLRGATGPQRTLRVGDVGHTVALDVRATDSTGSTNGYASLLGPVGAAPSPLRSIIQPAVSGAAVLGGSVHVDTGRWSKEAKSFAYQWLRCNANGRACTPIAGDSTASHTIVRRDVAHALLAVVQARSTTTSRAVLSLATTPAVASAATAAAAPSPTAPPAIAGVIQQGKQLTGSAGTWSGTGPISYAYQWYRCDPAGAHCLSIHGATKPTYTQVAKDVAHTLGLTVKATDAGGTSSGYANLAGPVAPSTATLVSTAQPTVSGTPNAGQTLQVTAGSWSQPPTALAYQWQRCNANGRLCASIASATAATYTVTAADAGHALLAIVQATAAGVTQPTVSVSTAAA